MKWLIDDARNWWRLWSVRLNMLGLAIMSYIAFDPSAVLVVINMMPAPVRSALPDRIELIVGGLIFALAMISRLVVQPRLEKRDGQN